MAFYSPIATESISAVTATPSVNLGERRWYNGGEYVYMYNAGNSDIPPKYCFMRATDTVGYSGTLTTVSGSEAIGIVVHATFTTGTYGWAMVKGITTVITGADASHAVNLKLGAGAAGLIATFTAAGPSIGRTLSAIASGGSGYAKVFFETCA